MGKRSRVELAPEYARRYTAEILDGVERDPEACHRSLIAERLAAEHGLPVTHLRPER